MLSVDVEKLYPAAKTLVKARAASRIHAKDATLYDFSPEAQACASDYMGWADLATSPLCDMDAIQAKTKVVGKSLDGVHVAQRTRGQIGPSHVVARASLRLGGEIVQRGVLGVNAACCTSFHQGLCRRIQLLNVNGEHGAPLLSGQFPPASRIANEPRTRCTGAPPR